MFDEILQRATSQSIAEFVMYGNECIHTGTLPLEERVRNTENHAMQAIEEKLADPKESDKLIEVINDAFGDVEKAYFEAGFKAGATALFNMVNK